ncbi:MAG: hypothetical protein GY937_17600 [bacterium]|nr:hypothetical protein [bacterium]
MPVFARVVRGIVAVLFALSCDASQSADARQKLGDRRYSVVIDAPVGLSTGNPGALVLEARPEAGHKLSIDFPSRLELSSSSGLDLPAKLDREAASDLREQGIRYSAPIQATQPGKQTIEGRLRVGVCTGDLCEPVEVPFEVELLVTAGS